MARLLDLPNEVLRIIIIENLLVEPTNPQLTEQSWVAWAETVTHATKLAIRRNASLYQLVLTCKLFHYFLQCSLCSQTDIIYSPSQLNKLAILHGVSPDIANAGSTTTFSLSLAELRPVFRLPGISSVQAY